MRACVCACVGACLAACVHTCLPACLLVCVGACVPTRPPAACMRACLPPCCMRTCMPARLRAWLRGCVVARLRAYLPAYITYVMPSPSCRLPATLPCRMCGWRWRWRVASPTYFQQRPGKRQVLASRRSKDYAAIQITLVFARYVSMLAVATSWVQLPSASACTARCKCADHITWRRRSPCSFLVDNPTQLLRVHAYAYLVA